MSALCDKDASSLFMSLRRQPLLLDVRSLPYQQYTETLMILFEILNFKNGVGTSLNSTHSPFLLHGFYRQSLASCHF